MQLLVAQPAVVPGVLGLMSHGSEGRGITAQLLQGTSLGLEAARAGASGSSELRGSVAGGRRCHSGQAPGK